MADWAVNQGGGETGPQEGDDIKTHHELRIWYGTATADTTFLPLTLFLSFPCG